LYSRLSTSPSALRSSTTAKGTPSGGSLGSSPCAAISATCSLKVTLNGLPSIAVPVPTRNRAASGRGRVGASGRVKT
jgi:hypothetical protein